MMTSGDGLNLTEYKGWEYCTADAYPKPKQVTASFYWNNTTEASPQYAAWAVKWNNTIHQIRQASGNLADLSDALNQWSALGEQARDDVRKQAWKTILDVG